MTLKEKTCPVCEATDVSLFLEIAQVPVICNVLYPTREEALRARRGDIRLVFCHECTHIFNVAFDSRLMEYTQAYENSLHFSPRFQEYARSLALRLIESYDLHGKNIIEIGCGKGDFLIMLCEVGGNRGVGFDPSYDPQRADTGVNEKVTFVQDFYSARYADYPADLICCRHVLEHIQFPRDFLTNLTKAIGSKSKTVIFFEVPSVRFMLEDLSIWDLIYEHCSYFTNISLAALFALSGYQVIALQEAFEGQFLCVEAQAGNGRPISTDRLDSDERARIATEVMAFGNRYREKMEFWASRLESMVQAGKQAILWGAGSKGVTFLNALAAKDEMAYIVDINPHKRGKYVPGTGQMIVGPDFLKAHRPDVIVVMNPAYSGEIGKTIEELGIASEVVCA